jgi:hypothetical protein
MSVPSISVALFLAALLSSGCDKQAGHTDYGAGIDESNLTPIKSILDNPGDFQGKTVTVKGVIASVCPSSGCFLRLGAGSVQIMVDLEKSGFNVPPGQNVGHLAYATGVVTPGGNEVKIDGTGVRILEK